MKRALLIAVLVLVPFGALVWLGFSMLNEPPPLVLPEPRHFASPTPMVAPVPIAGPVRKALEVSVPVRAPERQPQSLAAAVSPPAEPPAPVLPAEPTDPFTASVEPLVQQCFKDVSDRVKDPMRVTVAFDVTAGGGFSGVVVKKASWPDPHLAACIIDAFEDAKFEPSGLQVKRQTRTFAFGYSDAGR